MKKSSALKLMVLLLLLLGVTQVFSAGTGINNAGVLDNILLRFSETSKTWASKIILISSWLFWSLAVISMTWTGILIVLQKGELQDLFKELIRFFMTLGIFFWFLQNGSALTMAIINSLRQAAATASGLTKELSPSSIIDIGFDIVSKVVDNSSIWSPSLSTVGLLMALVILVVLAFVAIQLLLLLISSWLLAYAGIFVLGFGGSQWTQDIAINYFRTVLSTGMQIFAMILIVGIGRSFIDQYYAAMSGDMGFKELSVMLVVALCLLFLVKTVPALFAGIIGGGGGGGGTGASLSGMMGVGAIAAGTAASVLGGGIKSMGGSAMALTEAFKSAQSKMGDSSSGLSAASTFAKNVSSSLASGVSSAAKGKLNNLRTSVQESLGNTAGGQIANAIKQQNAPSFSENSLGGKGGFSQEVSNFTNKNNQ